MNAGTLTLSYNAASNTFTATVTAPPGFTVVSVMLASSSGSSYSMGNMSGGVNPSTWQTQVGQPGPSPGPSPTPPPAPPSGTWIATAMLQGMATCSGSTSVP
ncbi:MAG: hypothetical protein ACR2FY_07150 [Pirellulaceae bacterium]